MWLIYIYINSWMTAHNSLFGFIHSYKLDETNLVFNNAAAKQSPYPVIIHDPTIRQAYRNWNTADTGCLIFTSLALIAMAYPAAMGMKEFSILERRRRFISMSSLSIWVAFFCGLRNSYNRLQGLVPNGLPSTKIREPLKYNYTSEFLNSSVWSTLFESSRKQSQ